VQIWSAEIKEIETLYTSIKEQFPLLEKELERLVKTDDENIVLVYARRCLEVIITDLCECELKRPRKTEPLKGIIDKLNREEKVPSHIITSMQNLNSLSTYGAHPKEFDPEQVKPVLNNLTTIIKWYLKYKDIQIISKLKAEEVKDEIKDMDGSAEHTQKPKKKLIFFLSGLALLVTIVVIAFIIFDFIDGRKSTKELSELVKSIAVLPFENMSDDSEFAYLGDAMTDEIIMQLYKINEFEVRSRTSIMQYKDTEKGSPLIGKELNVNYLLEGSTQRYKDQVRIRVQLIHASTDDHIWGEIFEGEWKDIFNIQINVAKRVAHELKAVLSPEEVARIENEPTENIEAYNLYLKGRYFWNKRTKNDLEKSIYYFEEAINMDSTFALAYSGLAESYIVLGEWRYYPSNEVFPKAKEAAMKAIELDYELAEAHNAMAAVKADYEWDWPGAEREYLKAIELNPYYPTAYQWYAEFLSIMGRHDEAIENILYAQKLDPLSPIIYTVGGWEIYHYARFYDQAILQCQKALEIDSNYAGAYTAIAYNYVAMGMYEEALEEVKKAVSIYGSDMPDTKALLAHVYALTGKRNEAEIILNEIIGNLNEIYTCESDIAFIYIALNMKDQALEWLEKAYLNRSIGLIDINVFPIFDNLRAEPGFVELIRKMGF